MNRYLFQITFLGGLTKDAEVFADSLALAWAHVVLNRAEHLQGVVLLEGTNIE